MIRVIIVLIGILNCSEALSCYQCVDVSIKYDQEYMNDALDGVEMPRCDSSDKSLCNEVFDTCTATIISYTSKSSQGVSMMTETVTRGCAVSTTPQMVNQETVCGAIETGTKTSISNSNMSLEKFACRVETCTGDFCNTQEMENFQDDDHDEDHDDNNSSGKLSCYQCVDVSIDYDSESMTDDMKEQIDSQMPRCDSDDAVACNDYMDICIANFITYRTEQGKTSTVTRYCGASNVPQMVDSEVACGTIEDQMTSSVDVAITDFSCQVKTCSTDNCNIQELEEFQKDEANKGDDNHHEEDRYVSSEVGFCASLSLILTCISAATLFEA